MKVAFIDPNNNSTFYNFSLLSAFEHAGFKLHFLTSKFTLESQPLLDNLSSTHYFFLRLSTFLSAKYPNAKTSKLFKFLKGLEFFFDLGRLYFYLVKNNITVVHMQWMVIPSVTNYFLRFLTKRGIRIIYTVNNIYAKENDNGENIESTFVRRFLGSCSKLIVFTNTTKRQLLNLIDFPPEQIEILPHGNYDVFRINPELTKEQARKRLGLHCDRKRTFPFLR